MSCQRCGGETSRRKRTAFQRLIYAAVVACDRCGQRVFLAKPEFGILQRFCQCPECGTRDLSKLRSRDHVDKMNRNPLRMLLVLVGAPLYHCTFCRLQFRDWRARAPQLPKPSSGQQPGTRPGAQPASILDLCA